MSDRLRRTFSLAIKYAEGEMPSAAKLNGVSTQARSAFGILETAIGDLWNQAGDLILSPNSNPTENALHIPNISRSIGQMSLLNSMLPGAPTPLASTMNYVDNVGARYTGRNRAYLKYAPFPVPSVSNIILSGTFAPLVQGQFKSNPTDVIVTGDWCVTSVGKMYTFDNIPSTLTVTYPPYITPDISSLGTKNASWNVIPDPTTWSGNYAGVKISLANNVDSSSGYHIWLPPRKPLNSTKTLLTSPVASNNTAADPEAITQLFFQDSAANASIANADHYRYNLPDEITLNGSANDVLPFGFLYIWDETTGTIIEGMTSFVPGNTNDRKFKFRATGANLVVIFGETIGNGIVTDDTTQIPADYKSRFKVITTGSSLAKTIAYTTRNLWNHTHTVNDGTNAISHEDLKDLVTPGYHSSLNSAYPSGVHAFRQSSWIGDSHPQYLHRGGSTLNNGTKRDPDDNALFNRLLIKSPYTASTNGMILSADDSGSVVRISASTNTALVLEGSGLAAANLFACQVNRFLYFKSTTTPSSTLNQSNYIDFSSNKYSFISNNILSDINVNEVVSNSVLSSGDIIAAGDFEPSDRQGSFKYNSSRFQYLHISPMDFSDISGLARFQSFYIYNNDTGNTFVLFTKVNLPNGAILESGGQVRFWICGNGTTGITGAIIAYPKPSSTGFTDFTGGATSRFAFSGPTTNTNTVYNTTYGTDSVIDNSLTGNYYVLGLTFPVKISSAQPKFFGLTLQYRMPQVDN